MADLIDRKVLLREMEELYNKRAVDAYMTGDKEIRVSWNDAVYLVKVAPTIEAEPLKHGKWIRKESKRCYWFECSECGYPPPLDTFKREWFSNYCPNCGADMQEVEE